MSYTCEQYSLLETFKQGRLIDDLTPEELDVYQFPMSEGLLKPRADIEDGWHLLSEKGKRTLENRDKQIRQAAEQKAAEKKYRREDRIFQTFLLLFGYALGLLTGNLKTVIDWLLSLFE